jgi:hypothetical protein
MRFGKNVSQLICRGDGMKMQNTMLMMISNELTINLDMFCALMENIIMSNLYDTSIVTMTGRKGTPMSDKTAIVTI